MRNLGVVFFANIRKANKQISGRLLVETILAVTLLLAQGGERSTFHMLPCPPLVKMQSVFSRIGASAAVLELRWCRNCTINPF